MKVKTTKPNFTPVTIILESQEEINLIHAFTCVVSGTGARRKIIDNLNKDLAPHSTISMGCFIFEGFLRIKE